MTTAKGMTRDLFEALGPEGRPTAIREALTELGNQDETDRGAVFTRPEIVELLLDLVGYLPTRDLSQKSILEPSFGEGDFLLPAIKRLLSSFALHGGKASDADSLRHAVRAVEIHPHSFERTRALVGESLREWGMNTAVAERLCSAWLIRDDFLLTPLTEGFEFVVGNPPYVRQERIATALMKEYRRIFSTIWDRADLYIPFYERGLRLLSSTGVLAFICANRWIKNRYGRRLRELIASEYHLRFYIDLEGADAFHTEVIAYPSITVISSQPGRLTKVANGPDVSEESLRTLSQSLLADGSEITDSRIELIENATRSNAPWILHSASHLNLVQELEKRFPTLEEAGCKVGIGVATGADRVFVGDFDTLPVESSRKIRLAMAADIRNGDVQWSGKGLVNPFESDGTLASFADYPRFSSYMMEHRTTIADRHCAKKSQANWYRTIDRVWENLTTTPKLLVPDIKGGASVGFDPGEFYPHHNLYWITSNDWDLRALATILRSSVALLLVATYCTKMAGGFLRFQAQYLRRIRVPRWATLDDSQRTRLIAAPPSDQPEIDLAAFEALGIESGEGMKIQRFAAQLSARQ